MNYSVKKRKILLFHLLSVPASLFLIDRLFLTGNRYLLLSGSFLLLFVYSLALMGVLSDTLSFKQKSHNVDDGSDRDQSVPGILIPVEDESDLGELIEVDGDVPSYEPFQPERESHVKEYVLSVPFPDQTDSEVLEELEACEDPVEELEAVEE